MLGKSFGEFISDLVASKDEPNIKQSFYDLISNKMVINLNMLYSSMKNWIGCKVLSTHIVTP
jgi:hypothetical protein